MPCAARALSWSSPKPPLEIRIAHLGPLRPPLAVLCRQLPHRRLGAFGEAHHDRIAVVGRSSETFPDLVLVLDLDAARRQFPARRGKVGLDRGAGRQRNGRAELLIGVEFLAQAPPALGALVGEFQVPLRGS
jgi:hypothetical protein